MQTIRLEHRDSIAVVSLARGTINALDLQLISELSETLEQVTSEPHTSGLVLISSNDKFFSIGFDIPKLLRLTRSDLKDFYRAFNQACMRLHAMPIPTIAAITGHAIAGGCILAICCDYRFIAEGRRLMGLNEIKLGVPVPYVADCILRQLIGMRQARDVSDGGEFYPAEELLHMGIVDRVLPLEEVLPQSIERVKLLGASPGKAYEVIKRNRVEMIAAQLQAHLEVKEELFVECWYSDEAQARLREASEKFRA